MSVSIDGVNRTFRNIAQFCLTRLEDLYPLNLPKPQGLTIANNPTQVRVPTVDSQGYNTFAGSWVKGFDYQMQVQFAALQPELLAMRMGQIFESRTATIDFVKAFDVVTTEMAALTNADEWGYNITEDTEDATASYTLDNVTVELTRVGYSGTPTGTQFAVGAHAGFKFGPDLVGKRVVVKIPYEVTGLAISNSPIGSYKVSSLLITTENQVVALDVPSVTPNLDGSGFTPSAETLDIPFFIDNKEGMGRPYQVQYTNEYVTDQLWVFTTA
jgi:hypothetical protein